MVWTPRDPLSSLSSSRWRASWWTSRDSTPCQARSRGLRTPAPSKRARCRGGAVDARMRAPEDRIAPHLDGLGGFPELSPDGGGFPVGAIIHKQQQTHRAGGHPCGRVRRVGRWAEAGREPEWPVWWTWDSVLQTGRSRAIEGVSGDQVCTRAGHSADVWRRGLQDGQGPPRG